MSDKKVNCDSCVHQWATCCGADARASHKGGMMYGYGDCIFGPHSCEYWQASDLHSIAVSLRILSGEKVQRDATSCAADNCHVCRSAAELGWCPVYGIGVDVGGLDTTGDEG